MITLTLSADEIAQLTALLNAIPAMTTASADCSSVLRDVERGRADLYTAEDIQRVRCANGDAREALLAARDAYARGLGARIAAAL